MAWLEQLVQEYYDIQGYWVRTNVNYGPGRRGGYSGDADVLAFEPHNRVLVHLEVSMGAEKWEEKKATVTKKFKKAKDHYEAMCPHPFVRTEKVAITGWSSSPAPITIPGVDIWTLGQFMHKVVELVTNRFRGSKLPPEQYPLLRAVSFTCKFGGRT